MKTYSKDVFTLEAVSRVFKTHPSLHKRFGNSSSHRTAFQEHPASSFHLLPSPDPFFLLFLKSWDEPIGMCESGVFSKIQGRNNNKMSVGMAELSEHSKILELGGASLILLDFSLLLANF